MLRSRIVAATSRAAEAHENKIELIREMKGWLSRHSMQLSIVEIFVYMALQMNICNLTRCAGVFLKGSIGLSANWKLQACGKLSILLHSLNVSFI